MTPAHTYHSGKNTYRPLLWALFFLIIWDTPNAQGTFSQRGDAIIDEYAVGTIPGDIPKYGFWYAQANFVKGLDAQGRDVLSQTLASTPEDPPFAYWGSMDAYLRWKSTRYTDELKDVTRNFMTSFTGYDEGATQNHLIMLATARFLASEQWPASDFASGSDFAAGDPAGKNYLLFRLNEWVRRGVIEHDSPIYITFHLGPLRTLADHALDPEIRQLAALAFEWLMINSANEWMEGHYATSSLRSLFPYDAQNEYFETDMTLWLYFGGKSPDNFNLRSLPRACFAIGSIVSDYRLPEVIYKLANKREQPFLNRESHAVNTEWALDFRKTTFMDGDRYALYSQAELPPNQSSGLNQQSHRWGVVWQSVNGDDRKSAFWMKHGRRDISRNRAGTTRFEQVLQKDRTLVAIYNIASDQDFPYTEGFISDDYDAFIDSTNNVYFHYGNVLIAVLSLKELIWNQGDARIRSDHLKNGIVIETANPDRYSGEDAITQLAAFKTEIESIDRLEGSNPDIENPQLVYRSIYGHTLDIAYNLHRKIDGNIIDYTSWPLMTNPWVQQDVDSDIMVVSIDGMLRTYNFADLTISEGTGELLPTPSNFNAKSISSSEITLSWSDVDGETGYKIQRKAEGDGFVTIKETDTDIVSFRDDGLEPNTTYSYRIKALGTANNSFYSDPVFSTTWKLPPDAPDSLVLIQTFFDRIRLTWSDRSDTEEGFLVQRSQQDKPFSTIATLPPESVDFMDSTLETSGNYIYRIVAFNNGGESTSTEQNIVYKKKISRLSLSPSCSQDPSYELRWEVYNPNPFNVRIGWRSYSTGGGQYGKQVAPPGVSYFFTNPASWFNIAKVFWQNEKGRWRLRTRLSRKKQCNLPVPAVPDNVTVATLGLTRVQVNWKDLASNEDSYDIERLERNGFVLVGATEQNEENFIDEELSEGEAYTYRIRSFNKIFGHSAYSETGTATTASALAYYRLEGNVLDDNGINHAINSGVSFTSGRFDQAGSFNGENNYIIVPSGILSSARGAVLLWFNTIQSGRGMIFYGSAENSGNGFGPDKETHLNISRDGGLEFYSKGANDTELNAGSVNDGNWHMAVVSWDVEGRTDLYLDGELKGSAIHGGDPFTFSANIYLGRPSDNRRYFAGHLDEIKLYNVPLTTSEVSDIYGEYLSILSSSTAGYNSRIRMSYPDIRSQLPEQQNTFIFPNPAGAMLTMRFPEEGIWNLSISDVAGKRIIQQWNYEIRSRSEITLIDTSSLNKGLYLIHLQNGERRYIHKLIIDK
ncbi:T9SS type A sorting domain-containing protein [Fulvivirga sp. M361]|uniref:fibronectin type III domain-containing protein n=1 Tax=Fulvivirga sp. M361 TaxID=2594266 RepID=UPI00117A9ED4|nr:LamG-like jellyroll fold domain-containing protein [Fulvivirga sp. M361]TRX62042.1 T9SS type A sorting domain-containing protein [Fulvivirga sp. M361]